VGRSGELALLGERLASAADGHGQVVLVAGVPGAGKTALARHFLSVCAAQAVAASGDPDETLLPGGLLEQIAQSAATPAAQPLLDLLRSGRADPLSAGSALLGMLGDLAAGPPLVLVVDDAQWGDDLSLRALTFAVRRLVSVAVLCIVLTCPDELHLLPAGLLRAVADGGWRLDLGGLPPGDIAVLAELAGAGRLPPRAVQRLHEHTGGIPLHVGELLHDLPRQVLDDPAAVLPAPRSMETLVLSRLAACGPAAERMVVAAAVLGQECRLADAAALAGLADPLPALQEAVGQRLLRELDTARGRRCAFPHRMIRSAVYREIGASRRSALHLAAAGLTAGAAALAHRVAASQGGDPVLAADLDAQAKTEVAAGRLAEAAEHLLAAAWVGEQGAGSGQRLLAAVELLIDLGDAARARGYLGELRALPPSGMRSLVLGRLAMLAGDYGQAEQHLADAWEVLVPPASPAVEGAAVAACEMAMVLLSDYQTGPATRWAQRAAGAAAATFTRTCSRAVLGTCQALAGRPDQARLLLESDLARCADDRTELMVRQGLGTVMLLSDDPDGAAAQLGAVTAAEDHHGLPLSHLLTARLFRVVADYRRGAWDQATSGAERLVSLIDDLDQGWLIGRAHAAAVYPYAGRGQWAQAAAHAQVAAGGGRSSAAELVELVNAEVALAVARDDPAAVVAAVQPIRDRLGQLAALEPTLVGFWPGYACALVRLGQLGDAEDALRPFEQTARVRGRRSAIASAARVRGCLAAARQLPAAARASFADSLDLLAGLSRPYDEALTRLDYGRFLRRTGQRRAASRELWAARALFAALAAQPFLERCDAELGTDLRDSTAAAAPPLTARQRTVAQAVAAGRSNREIARDLYISVKTVEFHIGQILTRLGLDSRTQIAGALTEGAAGGGHGPGRQP
jgi:DNA-binding CsgD family transcriptional regulator